MLRTTPFHSRIAPLNLAQNWRRWSGYLAASAYELHHDREYWAIRNSAALIDVSPLYKYTIEGPDAERLLDRVVTRDVTKCKLHQVFYTPWCDDDGKVMDDGTLTRLTPDSFRLTSAEPNLRWLQDNALGMDVSIRDISDDLAALALQGPNARRILHDAAKGAADDLRFFRLAKGEIAGVPVEITRTGYTGDLGYEIWTEPANAEALWDGLMESGESHRILPAGMLALDVARVEAGLVLIGVDYVPAHQAASRLPTNWDSGGRSSSTAHGSLDATRFAPRRSVGPNGSSEDSTSAGTLSRRFTEKSACPRSFPPRGGGPAYRYTAEIPRSGTRRAAAGRRCSRSTSRWRTFSPGTPRSGPTCAWRSPSSTTGRRPWHAWWIRSSSTPSVSGTTPNHPPQ